MDKKLYPIKFTPLLKERIWGGEKLETVLNKPLNGRARIGESWEISGVEGDVSVVSNGFLAGNSLPELIEVYMGDLVGDKVFQKFGEEFPLLIKFIDAREALSIQVHPDDELARKRHNSFGKTEMWYVMQADEGSELISGFSKKITPVHYQEAVKNNALEDLLAKHPVKSGDVFYMPAGRVHAIGAGIMIAEIQQTSDVTYRIYDFNRVDENGNSRELHTELAVDAIDYEVQEDYKTNYKEKLNGAVEMVRSPYFVTGKLKIDDTFGRDYYALDSFVILICMEGYGKISYGEGNHESYSKGDTILIPAELRQISLIPSETTELLEVYVP
ncbi:type I phosphomannose isomerase catalytic subunit [Alkalitalea saponilacus]|uniref:Mannose-6-phosphate isomerase n=1 Tax=Alkalitalea saponilacus TaxID=889453 RepID=A0A1T5AVN1_9BACT|nr:type I phosphomannose isomerase catalytic subunit [Alkalitalea saponilacus]ASB48585.1 mannose-6-phosphate isomerase [Alkalitalea saponilacus]SKB38840.1 mannose-6-phosphate isomerase [Alkalitalea saponilacus]